MARRGGLPSPISWRLLLALVLFTGAMRCGAGETSRTSFWHEHSRGNKAVVDFPYETSYSGPYIDMSLPTNISAQHGGHAYLPCTVKRLGSQSVSWIRKSDGYLLTVDRDTFIADNRFQALHVLASDTWTLHIRNVRPSDGGQYECQVSSEPKTSLLFQLNIVVPRVEIRGSPDVYVKSGSGVELQCILSEVLEEPPFIFWYQSGERLLIDNIDDLQIANSGRKTRSASPAPAARADDLWLVSDKTPISLAPFHDVYGNEDGDLDDAGDDDVDDAGDADIHEVAHTTKKLNKPSFKSASIVRLQPGVLVSILSISAANVEDDGLYECRPSNMDTANVTLHVLDGDHEEPAAAIHDSSDSPAGSLSVAPWILFLASSWAMHIVN